jgi:hypothetical protein
MGDATLGASASLGTNLTVIFESTFSNWTALSAYLTDTTKPYDHNKLAVILHSVPQLSTVDTETTLRQLLAVGHSIWLTGTSNYTDFDTHFATFVERLAALSN